jgi:hypothetical protein
VVVVLFMPEGIVGTISRKLAWFKKAPSAPFATAAPVTAEEESQRTAINQ